ncbi:hypothetical protein [Bacillus sp. 03113]|uniref:hypothetical protein n=1 Tax=Bacillus sp. 03113 TaxID=2578211 RepID=UPI00114330AC|nr:hypothetical protein [Bacillus sp. 03113]
MNETGYRTEKRHAKVGERILITKAEPLWDQAYKNGDILTVVEANAVAKGDVYVKEQSDFIDYSEYEVITEVEIGMNNGIIEQMHAEIAELKSKVTALEDRLSNGKVPEVPKTGRQFLSEQRQESRDEIIEKAKRDVTELSTTWRAGCTSLMYPPSAFDPKTEKVNFEINREKRTVVCYITYDLYGKTHTSFRGIAKCGPTDCFNAHIGRAISLRRALGLEVPAEYLSVPQPTEVRVGDVIKTSAYRELNGSEFKTDVNSGMVRKGLLKYIRYEIIDDSRENEPKVVAE